MRAWRAGVAREEGVPPYVILTNRELREIVLKKPESPTALGHVNGLGPAKIKRYGEAILRQLHTAEAEAPADGTQETTS